MSGARTTTLDPARRRQQMAAAKRRHPSARPPSRRPAPAHFYALAIVIALLTLLGLVMVQSASSITALVSEGSGWVYFRRQLLWAALGMVALLVGLKVPYHAWRRLVGPILLVAFALMVLVLFPSFGKSVNGSRAWLTIGPFGLQPAEVMKLALLLYTADLMARREHLMNNVRMTLWPALVVLGGAGTLIMLQPDLGSGIVLVAIVLSVAFIAGSPMMPLGSTTALIGFVGLMFALGSAERRARWTAFLHLMRHRDDESFQVVQGIVGIASGGITGVGLGASRLKWGWLPEAHTDMIFAVLAEELGVVGVVVVCGLFVALGLLGISVALRCPDRFGMLLASGITAWLLVQAFINIGGVTGLLPLTGLTLPFVSFGGSSLLVTMAAAGLLLNVARNTR